MILIALGEVNIFKNFWVNSFEVKTPPTIYLWFQFDLIKSISTFSKASLKVLGKCGQRS